MIDIFRFKNSVIIDIHNDNVSILEGRLYRNEFKIIKYISYKLQENYLNLDYFFIELENKLKMNGFKTRNIKIIIDNKYFFNEKLKIPVMNKNKNKNIKKIIFNKYRNGKNINIKDHIIKYIDAGYSEKDNHDEIIIFAIKKNKVEKIKKYMNNIRLKSNSLTIRCNSLIKYLNFKPKINNKYRNEKLNIVVLDFDLLKTDITFIKKGYINFINSLDCNLSILNDEKFPVDKNIDIPDDNKYINEFKEKLIEVLDLLKINIDIFNRETLEDINLVLIVGKLYSINGINNFISKYIDIHTIVLDENYNGENMNNYIYALGELY